MTDVPRTVIFDFGGVLVDWNPRYLYRKLFGGDEPAMERFLAEVCTPEWNLQQDAGRPFAEAIAELVARYPEQAALIRAFHERWPETLGDAIAGSVAILGELRGAGHRLYGLTNWSHETWPLGRARFSFFDWFAGIVVSGEERLIKPDPKIFARLFERYAIDPARAVYIDDVPVNVAGAAAVGLDAIQFASPAQLRADLIERGLLAR